MYYQSNMRKMRMQTVTTSINTPEDLTVHYLTAMLGTGSPIFQIYGYCTCFETRLDAFVWGHAHITDFNIASELTRDNLATSLSGTKPYMAPEIFLTALGDIRGYSFSVDWWALGVTLFELLKKRRPFNIYSEMTPQETVHAICNTKIHFPSNVSDEMNDILRQLLLLDPQQRLQTLQAVQSHPAMANLDLECVKAKAIKPLFVPSKDHLNCDPTYELEEMIIETKPLHKKKKRLAKQSSKKDSITSEMINKPQEECLDLFKAFPYYNRKLIMNGTLSPGTTEQNVNSDTNQKSNLSEVPVSTCSVVKSLTSPAPNTKVNKTVRTQASLTPSLKTS